MDKYMKRLEQLAYLLIVAAAAVYPMMQPAAACMMAAGAMGIIACHLYEKYGTGDLRQRRLRKLRHLLGLLYGVTAYLMWQGGMDWVVTLIVAVVIELYTLFFVKDDHDAA